MGRWGVEERLEREREIEVAKSPYICYSNSTSSSVWHWEYSMVNGGHAIKMKFEID